MLLRIVPGKSRRDLATEVKRNNVAGSRYKRTAYGRIDFTVLGKKRAMTAGVITILLLLYAEQESNRLQARCSPNLERSRVARPFLLSMRDAVAYMREINQFMYIGLLCRNG